MRSVRAQSEMKVTAKTINICPFMEPKRDLKIGLRITFPGVFSFQFLVWFRKNSLSREDAFFDVEEREEVQ